MRAWLVLVSCFAAVVGASGVGWALAQSRPPARTPAAAVSGWSQARQIPGTETISRQVEAVGEHSEMGSGITSVDCPARANCAVSGGYVGRGFNFLVFAGGEHAGRWGRAAVLPGDAALVGNSGKADSYPLLSGGFLSQVACSSPGNCAVAGNYQARELSRASAPLLGIERGGRWEKVHPLSGAARALLAVSCPPAAGRCAAGGGTAKGAFVIDEHGGTWARYQSVAGARWPVTAMSCPAAGTCLAVGGADPTGGGASASALPFIASESGGRWTAARPVPGLSKLIKASSGIYSYIDSVSCGAAGDCTLIGGDRDRAGHAHVFVASERGGRWRPATAIPGLDALGQGNRVVATQVSCGSANLCAAGGFYQRGIKDPVQAWVATEIRGRWHAAEPVPGSIALNTNGIAVASSVSCSRTTCMAGGYYSSKSHQGVTSGFLATEQRGTWGDAAQVPGLAKLNTDGYAQVVRVSCAPHGYCAAIGEYAGGPTLEDRMFETTRSG
ncbi:MAG: hypothetical protein ACRDRJ_09165 [Streptosporangiaceae bacterium]